MKKVLLILTLTAVSITFLSADVYIKSRRHSDAAEIAGKKIPAQDIENEQWLGNSKFADISASQRIIIDLNKNVIIMIFPPAQTYIETGLPFNMAKLLPEETLQRLALLKATIKVTKNGQSKKIKKWQCTGYNIDIEAAMMTMKTEAWVTQDVPFDWSLYSKQVYPHIMKVSMARMTTDEDSINEYKKIAGFIVSSKITSTVGDTAITITYEVTEISEKQAPADVYSVPAGYTRLEKIMR